MTAALAVVCKGWRWVPGMSVYDDRHEFGDGTEPASRVIEVRGGTLVLAGWRSGRFTALSCEPDLDDPATLGCIAFGLLPTAWGRREISVDYYDGRWWVGAGGDVLAKLDVFDPDARGEALVAALEAAP